MATPATTTTSQSPMERMLMLLTEIVVKDREDRHAEKEAMREIEERREDRRRQEIEEARLETLERQKELELMRMDHEKKLMMALQQEFIKKNNQEIENKKMVNRMSKLEDHDQPEAYFHHFEEIMKEAEISVEDWPHHLLPLLTGKALSAYSKNVPEQARLNYYDMKEALLSSLGPTVEQCRNEFWVLQRKYGETFHSWPYV